MNKCKVYLVSVISGLLLFNMGGVYAAPSSADWSKLSQIEKRVLRPHARKWNAYGTKKQNRLLEQSHKEIERKNAYKKWFHEKLPKKERTIFATNMKKMSKVKFRRYVDTLRKRYPLPK